MSINRFQDLQKRTQRIQEECLNSPSLWNNCPEEEQQNIEKVKQKWQKKQHQKFQRLQKEESQNKNIKTIVFSLITITLTAIVIPHLPQWWLQGKSSLIALFPQEEETSSSSQPQEEGFLDKLKALKEKKETNGAKDGENGIKQGKNGEKQEIKQQLEESVDHIDEYNDRLQKAIDMSDGKKVNLSEEKK